MVPHRPLIIMAALMVSAGTAGAQDIIKPRFIEPGRIIAVGEFPVATPAVKPRTIVLNGIVAQGSYSPVSSAVSPRTIALNGIVAQGSYTPVSPRTIRLTGWTASPPRGKK